MGRADCSRPIIVGHDLMVIQRVFAAYSESEAKQTMLAGEVLELLRLPSESSAP